MILLCSHNGLQHCSFRQRGTARKIEMDGECDWSCHCCLRKRKLMVDSEQNENGRSRLNLTEAVVVSGSEVQIEWQMESKVELLLSMLMSVYVALLRRRTAKRNVQSQRHIFLLMTKDHVIGQPHGTWQHACVDETLQRAWSWWR